MYTLNIAGAIKKRNFNEIRDLSLKIIINDLHVLKKTVIIQWNTYKKELLLLSNKLIGKIPDPRNAKEHYQSFLKKKSRKSVKQSEIITYQPKTFKNPNIVDIKPVVTEYPEPSHKLLKTIRQAEKVSSNSSLYSDTRKT